MSLQMVVPVTESSQVGEVRRSLANLGKELSFSETQLGEAAIVAAELAKNLVLHAKGGRIFLRGYREPAYTWIEILSVDSGPGMPNVQRCLTDGYSTVGTSGIGLGAVRRLSSEFDVFSMEGVGTIIVSRIGSHSLPATTPRWSVLSQPAPYEVLCGDDWGVTVDSERLSIVVADGLGHGPQAHEAASRAVQIFKKSPHPEPLKYMADAHRALNGTRGAAVAMVRFELLQGKVDFVSVGNIASGVVSKEGYRGLMSYNGIVGSQIPRLQAIQHPWNGEVLLIMHSDGLQTRWRLENYPGLVTRHPAIIAGVLFRDFMRGRDDATIVVARVSRREAL